MELNKALSKAAVLCSKQERCISEMQDKLLKWGVESVDAEKIIEKLIDEKYLDEERYAVAYVRDKYRFNRWGRVKIKWHLKQKGVVFSVIDEALMEIDENEYNKILDELLLAKNLLIKNKDYYQRKSALIRFASSRGFEADLIYKKIEQFLDH